MKIHKIFKIAVVTLLVLVPFFALAQTQGSACGMGGLFVIRDSNGNVIGSLIDGMPIICTAQQLIAWIIQLALGFAGVVATLSIIIGGYWYLTAGGNDEQAEKGRKVLTNSVIGLVVILMASVIVRVVLNTLNNTSSGSGTTTTQNGNTSNQGNGSSGALIIDGFSEIPSEAEAGSKITLSYNLSTGSDAEAKAMRDKIATEYCNGNFTGATLDLFIGGKKVSSSSLSQMGTSIRANVSGNLPDEVGTTAVQAGICGKPVDGAGRDVNINPGMSAPPTSAKIDAAAKALDFGFRKLNATTLRITITGSQSDKMAVCGVDTPNKIGQGTLELLIDGQSAKKANADVSYVDWDYGEPLDELQSFTVMVEMCGHSIGGGYKEYIPGPRG